MVGKAFQLEPPFLVLATQNPVEQEGTYPLPEAQLDRFMFLIELDYPSEAEEIQIARTTTGDALPTPRPPADARARSSGYQHLVRRVPVPDHIYTYAARLVRKTRPERLDGPGLAQAAGLLGRRPAGRAVPDPGPRPARPCSAATWSGSKTSRKSPRRC